MNAHEVGVAVGELQFHQKFAHRFDGGGWSSFHRRLACGKGNLRGLGEKSLGRELGCREPLEGNGVHESAADEAATHVATTEVANSGISNAHSAKKRLTLLVQFISGAKTKRGLDFLEDRLRSPNHAVAGRDRRGRHRRRCVTLYAAHDQFHFDSRRQRLHRVDQVGGVAQHNIVDLANNVTRLKQALGGHPGHKASDAHAAIQLSGVFHADSQRAARCVENAIAQDAYELLARLIAEVLALQQRHQFVGHRLARHDRRARGHAIGKRIGIERARQPHQLGRNGDTGEFLVGRQLGISARHNDELPRVLHNELLWHW